MYASVCVCALVPLRFWCRLLCFFGLRLPVCVHMAHAVRLFFHLNNIVVIPKKVHQQQQVTCTRIHTHSLVRIRNSSAPWIGWWYFREKFRSLFRLVLLLLLLLLYFYSFAIYASVCRFLCARPIPFYWRSHHHHQQHQHRHRHHHCHSSGSGHAKLKNKNPTIRSLIETQIHFCLHILGNRIERAEVIARVLRLYFSSRCYSVECVFVCMLLLLLLSSKATLPFPFYFDI